MQTKNYQENYTGRYALIDEEGLRELLWGKERLDEDLRPFRVVMRYLQQMGYKPGVTDTGSAVLVYERKGQIRVRTITRSKMLHICIDRSREAQENAGRFYQRCCAEEDEAELEYVLQLQKNIAPQPSVPSFFANKSRMQHEIYAEDTEELEREWEKVKIHNKEKDQYLPPHLLF